MSGKPPFLYQPERWSLQSSFDPKAVTRASNTPKPPRPKQEGPLIQVNRHPDSYFTIYSSNSTSLMHPSTKKRITWVRIVQLVLRCLELIGAAGLLVLLILIKGIDTATAWILRIPPGVTILCTIYAIYHLSRKPSGRTPGSSASYMIFASVCDVSIIPFYVFNALLAAGQYKTAQKGTGQDGEWSTLLPQGQDVLLQFTEALFLASVVAGGLHLISLCLGIWLTVKFRQILNLPPDMNPLEDNLTSRHKRNKSALSTSTTMSASEKRLSEPLESKRSSGAPYEDLDRPPTIPFLSTRQSMESVSTYHSTPPPSRGSNRTSGPRLTGDSIAAAHRSLMGNSSSTHSLPPSRRGPYMELATDEDSVEKSPTEKKSPLKEAWFVDAPPTPESSPPRNLTGGHRKKASYQQLQQRYDAQDDDYTHPNPLRGNPTGAGRPKSALSEISLNRRTSGTGDIADTSRTLDSERASGRFRKSKPYEALTPGTPPFIVGQNRQVSSGNDYAPQKSYRRDVSGKVAEEGRAVNPGWGARFRRVSGK